MKATAIPFFFSTILLYSAFAENWPQLRGPRGDGTSLEKAIPISWSPTENIAWKAAVPGEGHSSPIVWEQAVFLTSVLKPAGERMLLRLDAGTGKVVWQKTVLQGEIEPMHRENSSASSTPATDGKHVYTSFQSGDRVDLRCFDYAGNLVWSKQPLKFEGEHGYSYSPILYKDLLIFDCRQEGEAALLAIEKGSGNIRWRAEPSKRRISHIAPLLITHNGKQQLIVSGSNETCSYDPETGKLIWRTEGPSDVAVAGLTFGEGLVFTAAGYPTRLRMAIDVSGQGDVTQSKVAWSFRRQATYVPSPVYHQGHLYSVLDEGMLYCFNARTGEPVWEERLSGRFRSSMVLADGKIYATNDKGVTTVFEASPVKFKKLAENNLNEFCYTTPALSGGALYLRTGSHLYKIGK